MITGIADHWAIELARKLERDPSVEFIAGIDSERPAADLERTEFIEADLRSPLLSRLIPATEPDTVVHCGIVWYPTAAKPARSLHDINVIGSLQLLAACEKAPTLERVVVRGSAAIYGCEGASPSFFTEDMARGCPCAPASSAISASSRTTSRPSRGAAPTSSARCSASSPRSGPGLRTPAVALPVAAGGAHPARVGSAAAAASRR